MAVESCRVSHRIVRIRNIWSGARKKLVNVTGKLHARFAAEQKVCLIQSYCLEGERSSFCHNHGTICNVSMIMFYYALARQTTS